MHPLNDICLQNELLVTFLRFKKHIKSKCKMLRELASATTSPA